MEAPPCGAYLRARARIEKGAGARSAAVRRSEAPLVRAASVARARPTHAAVRILSARCQHARHGAQLSAACAPLHVAAPSRLELARGVRCTPRFERMSTPVRLHNTFVRHCHPRPHTQRKTCHLFTETETQTLSHTKRTKRKLYTPPRTSTHTTPPSI